MHFVRVLRHGGGGDRGCAARDLRLRGAAHNHRSGGLLLLPLDGAPPGYGLVEGPWDLRGGVDDYLGGVDLRDKRVLEVGTASGFLCFTMEGRGAEVVAYDLSDKQSWDVVPYAQYDHESFDSERREHLLVAEQQLVVRPPRVRVLGQGRLRNRLRDSRRDRSCRRCHVRQRAAALPRPVPRARARAPAHDRDGDRHGEPIATLLAAADGGQPPEAEHGVPAELRSGCSRASPGGTSRRRRSSRCSASSVSRTRRSSTTYSASKGGGTRSSQWSAVERCLCPTRKATAPISNR